MRTEKELLQVLLDNMDKFETGLCLLVQDLYELKLININELKLINVRIRNIPDRYDKEGNKYAYKWVVYQKQPRIDWLKEQINKL